MVNRKKNSSRSRKQKSSRRSSRRLSKKVKKTKSRSRRLSKKKTKHHSKLLKNNNLLNLLALAVIDDQDKDKDQKHTLSVTEENQAAIIDALKHEKDPTKILKMMQKIKKVK